MSRAGRVEAGYEAYNNRYRRETVGVLLKPMPAYSAMSAALTASDALLRTDESIERVARLLAPITYGVTWSESASGMRDTCRLDAYEIITALLGEGS